MQPPTVALQLMHALSNHVFDTQEFGVPALYLAKNSVLNCFATGKSTGISIDCAHEGSVGTGVVGGGGGWLDACAHHVLSTLLCPSVLQQRKKESVCMCVVVSSVVLSAALDATSVYLHA